MEVTTYSTAQVAARSGATPRQLQWWDEQGLIQPIMAGHARVYDEQKLQEVCVMVALRRQGVSLQQARRVLKSIRTKIQDFSQRTIFATDGRRTFVGPNADEALRAIVKMKRDQLAICELPCGR